MKKTLNLSIGYILVFALGTFSIINLVSAFIDWNNLKNALDINAIHSSQIQKGQYATGIIDDFLVRPDMGVGLPPTGNQGGVITLDGDFNIYTIKTQDNKYILLSIKDDDKLELLYDVDAFFESDGITIDTKIITNEYQINYEWYKNAFGVETDAQVDELVIGEFAFLEVDYNAIPKRLREFSVLTIISIALFFMIGGTKNLITIRSVSKVASGEELNVRILTNEHSQTERNYTLKKYRADLNVLLEKRDKQKKGAILGAIFLLLCFACFYISMRTMFFPILIAIVFFFYGIKNIWIAFINSGNSLAIKISNLFNINTLESEINTILSYIIELDKLNYK